MQYSAQLFPSLCSQITKGNIKIVLSPKQSAISMINVYIFKNLFLIFSCVKKQEKALKHCVSVLSMAESQGFEPWVRDYRTHDFQL